MITVTTRAKDALLQIRAAANIEDPEIAMRLEPEESGFGLAPDTQKPGDQVVEFAGTTVLLVEDELAQDLTGVTIDSHTTDAGERLVIEAAEPSDGDDQEEDGDPAVA
jgi:hypothetical protein